MLSRIEVKFLKSPENFDPDYRRVLRHRVNSKIQRIRDEVALLERCGVRVTENCNGITEFCNGKSVLNQVAFKESRWTGGDLNPRPPECKSGIHTRLNYQPIHFLSEESML